MVMVRRYPHARDVKQSGTRGTQDAYKVVGVFSCKECWCLDSPDSLPEVLHELVHAIDHSCNFDLRETSSCCGELEMLSGLALPEASLKNLHNRVNDDHASTTPCILRFWLHRSPAISRHKFAYWSRVYKTMEKTG